jgi:hypothetical protein
MYIHLGDKKTISGKKCIGIFNVDTLSKSIDNLWIMKKVNIDEGDKLIAIEDDNTIITTKVSPFTVLKRTALPEDFIWRKMNV